MPQITVRIDQGAIDYRDAVCEREGIKKSYFDQQVFDYYIKHHPLNDHPRKDDDE